MSDAELLLSKASELPWIRPWTLLTVRAGLAGDNDVLQKPRNIDLAVYAVNRLPDYEAAVEALERLINVSEKYVLFSGPEREDLLMKAVADANRALVRLRDEVPA